MKLKMAAGVAAIGLLILSAGCGNNASSSAQGGDSGSVGADYLNDCKNKIEMIVGYTAGGATDTWARILANALSKKTGAKFQVVNMDGAGGSIGIQHVISAPPDGCTIGNINLPSGLQYLLPGSPVTYDKSDMQLIGETGYSPNGIVVAAKSKYKTVDDLIADAKDHPGQVDAASDGPGSDDAIAYYRLEQAADIKINQVVLNGSADKVTSLLGGQIDMFGGSITGVVPQIRNHQVRILCVYADKPSKFAPGAPTCKSHGVDVLSDNRWSLMTGSDVPKSRVQYLEKVMLQVAKDPAYQEANEKVGIEVVPLTGEQLSREWDKQAAVYKEVAPKLS